VPAELVRVEQWIYQTLVADPTVASIVGTRVYGEKAPQGQEDAYPMVLIAHIGNVDVVRTWNNGRMAKNIMLVRVVGEGSSVTGDLTTVADRFDSLLLKNNVVVDGVRIAYVQHDQHAIRKDSENGVPIAYVGSYYLFFTQPA
jgi:hypothetical protein